VPSLIFAAALFIAAVYCVLHGAGLSAVLLVIAAVALFDRWQTRGARAVMRRSSGRGGYVR
jgi:hypothetical protein